MLFFPFMTACGRCQSPILPDCACCGHLSAKVQQNSGMCNFSAEYKSMVDRQRKNWCCAHTVLCLLLPTKVAVAIL